jgi:hypothetical protein
MALRDQPYLPLYVQDYLTDEKLNACCPATQGIYIKIMCILHKSEEYGKLLLKQKDQQSPQQIKNFAYRLAKLLPFRESEIELALTELIDEGVMSIDGNTLYQKRMVKDGEISEKRALAANRSVIKRSKNEKFATANVSANHPAKAEQITENEYEYENANEDVIENADEKKQNLQNQRFDEFWKAYPKKVGKEAARKVWMKVKPDKALFIKMLEAVETAKKSKQWQKDNGQYIPNPSTWLNQGRWDDELDTSSGSSNPFA